MGFKSTLRKIHASANPKAAEKLAREQGKSDAEVDEAVAKAKQGEETVIVSTAVTAGGASAGG